MGEERAISDEKEAKMLFLSVDDDLFGINDGNDRENLEEWKELGLLGLDESKGLQNVVANCKNVPSVLGLLVQSNYQITQT